MKEFSISVETSGCEYYIVTAETFEEAVEEIKSGEGYLAASESEWVSEFHLDSEEDI